jgi:hypothetical protein
MGRFLRGGLLWTLPRIAAVYSLRDRARLLGDSFDQPTAIQCVHDTATTAVTDRVVRK